MHNKTFKKAGSLLATSLFAAGSFMNFSSQTPMTVSASTVSYVSCTQMHGAAACAGAGNRSNWNVEFAETGNWGGTVDYHYKVYMDGGNERLYCVQPLRNIVLGTSNYNPQDLGQYFGTAETTRKLQMITSLGYGFNGDTSDEMDYATQVRIWQELGHNPIYIPSAIQAKIDQINERLRIANTPVNFGTTQVTLNGYGKEHAVTLTDTNGVFQYYKKATVEGLHSEQNGNSLTIWAEKGDKLSGRVVFDCFWLANEASAGNSIVYSSGTSQDVALIKGRPDPNAVQITTSVTPYADIAINKTIAYNQVDKSLLKDNNLGVNGLGFTITAKSDITLQNGTQVKAGNLVSGLTVQNGKEENGVYYIQSNDGGNMTIGNIPAGTYELRETVQHEGLVTNSNVYEFKVNADTTVTWTHPFEAIVNIPTITELSKLDEDEVPVAGAHMEIYDESGKLVDSWITTDSGTHRLEGLKPGNYTLHEKQAPDGFVAVKDIEFTISDTGEIQTTAMVDIENTVEKIDQFGRKVSGALLTVKDKDGNTVDQWISGRNLTDISEEIQEEILDKGTATWEGQMNTLPYQIQTQKGQPFAGAEQKNEEEKTDSVEPSENETDTEKNPDENTGKKTKTIDDVYTFTMTPKTTIQKDEQTEEEGAENEGSSDIYSQMNSYIKEVSEKISSLKADEKKELEKLVNDIAKAVETKNDEAIETARTALNEKLSELNIELETKESPKDGKYTLKAVDANGDAFYFETDIDGNELDHRLNNVVVGETYILEETKAPDKYIPADPIEFTVGEGDVSLTNILTDEVSISKKDATNKEELPGAELTVKDEDGNIIDKWISTTEQHVIKGLIVGKKYTLTEITAPDGYNVAEEIEFEIEDNGAILQHVEMFDTRKPKKVQTGLDSSVGWFIGGGVLVLGVAIVIVYKMRKAKDE